MHTPRRETAGRLRLTAGAVLAVVTISACSTTGNGAGGGGTVGESLPSTFAVPDASGPGVTASTITLNWDSLASAEEKKKPKVLAGMDAVVDSFNAQGGIMGRKVAILRDSSAATLWEARSAAYRQVQGLQVTDSSHGAEACDAYSAGPEFFSLIGGDLIEAPLGTPAAATCLGERGHPTISTARAWYDADFVAAPYSVGLGMSLERKAQALAAAAQAANLATDEPIALLVDESVPPAQGEGIFVPAFNRAGFANVDVITLNANQSESDAVSLAVRLKSQGYSQLAYLPIGKDSVVAQSVVSAAQAQRYYPRQVSLDTTVFGLQLAVEDQMLAAIHSYASIRSGMAAKTSASAVAQATPAGQLCEAARTAVPKAANFVDDGLRDALMLLKTALEKNGPDVPINAQSFINGVNQLGDSYSSPTLFATSFGPQRHDAGAGIVESPFDKTCGCVSYGTKVITF